MSAGTVICGFYHTLFQKGDGTIWVCGRNHSGQLGIGNTVNQILPVKTVLKDITEAGRGGAHTVFIKKDGTVWGCGSNSYGQLGLSGRENRLLPTQIDMKDVLKVECRGYSTFFLKNDGTVWACGQNNHGQLGVGNTVDQTEPVKIKIEDVKEIRYGGWHTLFLKTDGTVWGCGLNTSGQLGLGDKVSRLEPVKVNIQDVIQAACGAYHTIFLKKDGTVWSCGQNNYGQLGIGNTVNQNNIVKVDLMEIEHIESNGSHTLFLKRDGTVWSCGQNNHGQLGIGNTVNQVIPVKAEIENVKEMSSGGFHSAFVKNDGTAWSCGWNQYGEVGIGKSSNVPVMVIKLVSYSFLLQMTNNIMKTIMNEELVILEKQELSADNFQRNGFTEIQQIKNVSKKLENKYRILCYDPTRANMAVIMSHLPEGQLISSLTDMDLSAYHNIKQMTFTTTGTTGSVRVVFSFDRGKTWNTFIEGAWKGITLSIDSVQADGITPEALSAIPPEKWNEMNTGTLRIACCLSKAAVTDDMAVDTLAVTGDTASWKKAKRSEDYDCLLTDSTTMTVQFLTDGNYKINYMEVKQ